MASSRALLVVAVIALLVAGTTAATCKQYTGKQAGARCGKNGDNCCVGPLWCDNGRCSARSASDAEKLKLCSVYEMQVGNRCDINNGLCCGGGMKCNVGRCSK